MMDNRDPLRRGFEMRAKTKINDDPYVTTVILLVCAMGLAGIALMFWTNSGWWFIMTMLALVFLMAG